MFTVTMKSTKTVTFTNTNKNTITATIIIAIYSDPGVTDLPWYILVTENFDAMTLQNILVH